MRKIAGILLVITSLMWGRAVAADFPAALTLTWTNPDRYVDGSAIMPGDLAFIHAFCWRNNAPDTMVIDSRVPINAQVGSQQTYTWGNSISRPGTYICAVAAVTVDETYSDLSNTVERKYTGKPNPPAALQ